MNRSNSSARRDDDSSRHHAKSVDLMKPIPRIPKKSKKRAPSLDVGMGGNSVGKSSESSKKFEGRMALDMPIPRQKKVKPLRYPPPGSLISVVSETPLVLRVDTKSLSIITTSPSNIRSSERSGIKRKSYTEKETDSDFLQSDSEDEAKSKKKAKRLRKGKANVGAAPSGSTVNTPNIDDAAEPVKNVIPVASEQDNVVSTEGVVASEGVVGFQIEAPPAGILPSLWYSRESCIHVWVIEKIIGWKTRYKFELTHNDESLPFKQLEKDVAHKIRDKLINNCITQSERMNVSRISPRKCHSVLKVVAGKEKRKAQKEGRELIFYPDQISSTEEEEVLLIKWRGRSYFHCSWERPSDLERLDPTNNTAKGKIKRYYQTQYTALGYDWRKVLTDRRDATGTGHGVEAVQGNSIPQDEDDALIEDDFFSPDFLEVERILACDENEMDMALFANQRALNIANERGEEALRQRELLGIADHVEKKLLDDDNNEEQWDPEDYVRYVVKWKGLQLSEVTWEYWLNIKHDSVEQGEDFWHRQKPPEISSIRKSHPHMREYKKLTESPAFGGSERKRPIANIRDGKDVIIENGEEEDTTPVLQLRSYQLEGVNWLLWNWWNKRSCILADEMGLGKTIQSMCFLDQLQRLSTTQVRGPFLIVAPLSLVNQWQSEAKVWAPDMNVLLYHGSLDGRSYLTKEEFYYSEQFLTKNLSQKLKREHITKFDILITSYEVVMKDLNILSKIRWKALIVDEAHRLKNNESRLFQDLGNVPRDFCLLLTGTPLQNSTEELWSLLNFSDKKAFASKDEFTDKFGQLSDSKQVSDLHSILKPYLLRRVKEDVEKSLPPKEETILEVALTPIQKKYYKAIYERNTAFLFKGSKPSNAPSLMNIMMELRKCCNHPFLIKGAEDRIIHEAASKKVEGQESNPVLRYQQILAEQLVQSSGKMVLLMKLLPKLQSGGHKVLIFSQMVRVLDLLEELVKLQKYSYERLDGSTRASSRAAAVDRFNKKSYRRFVMLLSTRAGGLGLNLTSADTIIIFDSDWNPQNDLQAMARAHRIGQTRPVKVYRLLTAKTYEIAMFHSASMKLGLDRAVLAHQRQQGEEIHDPTMKKSKEMQAKEIDELLKKGAYDVFRDDDDAEAKNFMDTDIDQLLERSSRTVTYGNTASKNSSGLGSFSKASFVTSNSDGKDVDLDDPDFWSKTIGLEAPVETTINENILSEGEKRSRKQVQVFDPYAAFEEEEDSKKKKIELKAKFEKEERKRLKEEKRLKREEERDQKKREKEEARILKQQTQIAAAVEKKTKTKMKESKEVKLSKGPKAVPVELKTKVKKIAKELLAKKIQRADQRRVLRAIEREDPIVDRMRQGWDINHRDRVIDAVLLFGFGRFCKIRNECNLLSLPIQDIELFLRAYIFQLGLQASISMMEQKDNGREILTSLCCERSSINGPWVAKSMISAVKHYELCERKERDIRIPQILNDPIFVDRLRSGAAMSSLLRMSFLTTFNEVVTKAAEEALSALGTEARGRRSCYSADISTLDNDLKIRLLTIEELNHSLGRQISSDWKIESLSRNLPFAWWDRSCDIALIVGTFLHGYGNYEAILQDQNMPFYGKISTWKNSRLDQTIDISKAVQEASVFDKNEHSKSPRAEATAADLSMDSNKSTISAASKFDLPVLARRVHDCLYKAAKETDTGGITPQDITFSGPTNEYLDSRLDLIIQLISTHDPKEPSVPRTVQNKSHNIIFHAMCEKLGLVRRKASIPSPFCHESESESSFKLVCPKKFHCTGIPALLTSRGLATLLYTNKKILERVAQKENSEKIAHPPSDPQDITLSRETEYQGKITANFSNISIAMRNDVKLRDCICAAYFCTGSFGAGFESIIRDFWGQHSPIPLEGGDLQRYVNDTLMPHCVRLCFHRFSFENAGDNMYSHYQEKNFQVPSSDLKFPDPMIELDQHSLQSREIANALLRRASLYKSLTHLFNLEVKEDTKSLFQPALDLLAKIKDGLPLWWTSKFDWIMLCQAQKYGILHAVMKDCSIVRESSHPLHPESLRCHVRKVFLQGLQNDEDAKATSSLIPHHILQRCSNEDLSNFIETQINDFPSTLVVEKRLVLLCSEACKSLIKKSHSSDNAHTWAFYNLPMTDHAQWET